jgi:nucleolar protein 6
MSSQQKLSKKQKKALAYRGRKGKSKAVEESLDVPIGENPDLAEMEGLEVEVEQVAGHGKAQVRLESEAEKDAAGGGGSRKRKREEGQDLDEVVKMEKRKKNEADKTDDTSVTKTTPRRFILFIGNAGFTLRSPSLII